MHASVFPATTYLTHLPCCLPPPEQLIAEKFRRTYDLEAKGGLGELLAAGDSRGADWDRYKDVNMLQAGCCCCAANIWIRLLLR